jgi:hypothetical protein
MRPGLVPLCLTLLCLAMSAGCAHQVAPHAARNIELLAQYYQHGKNRDHVRQAAMWAGEAINLGQPVRPDGIRTALEDIHRAFPDYQSVPLETRAVGDTVVQMSRMSGTHLGVATTGIFGGLLQHAAPTGRRFEVLVTHWWRFNAAGQIVWHQVTRDDLGMYQQLGLLPARLPTEKAITAVQD